MKLTSPPRSHRKSGMTLLEVTIVILILLSLISILFIGARGWKRGTDRAANILNIRNVQQAVRAYAHSRTMNNGTALSSSEIVGAGKYFDSVTAPNPDITYSYGSTVPAFGSLYLIATYAGTTATDYAPTASSYSDW